MNILYCSFVILKWANLLKCLNLHSQLCVLSVYGYDNFDFHPLPSTVSCYFTVIKTYESNYEIDGLISVHQANSTLNIFLCWLFYWYKHITFRFLFTEPFLSFILFAIDSSADYKYVGVIKFMAHMLKWRKRDKKCYDLMKYISIYVHTSGCCLSDVLHFVQGSSSIWSNIPVHEKTNRSSY